ncbi:uncharacterized protein LOC142093108 [Calonectris borealis]|uniref:uncharacterized protein LOC142093108 n=1 Tax=Calonectris borealis TaxID=1323832 RepID=UPI003F4C1F43
MLGRSVLSAGAPAALGAAMNLRDGCERSTIDSLNTAKCAAFLFEVGSAAPRGLLRLGRVLPRPEHEVLAEPKKRELLPIHCETETCIGPLLGNGPVQRPGAHGPNSVSLRGGVCRGRRRVRACRRREPSALSDPLEERAQQTGLVQGKPSSRDAALVSVLRPGLLSTAETLLTGQAVHPQSPTAVIRLRRQLCCIPTGSAAFILLLLWSWRNTAFSSEGGPAHGQGVCSAWSPGTRSTSTPQLTSQAEKDAEQSPAVPAPRQRSSPRPGTAASPKTPRAAVQTCGKYKQHNKLPVTGGCAETAQAPRCGLVLVPSAEPRGGLSARPRQGQIWALLGKQRDVGSSHSPVLLTQQPRLLTGLLAKCCWCSTGTWKGFPGQPENKLQNQKLTQRTEMCNPVDFSETYKQIVPFIINCYDEQDQNPYLCVMKERESSAKVTERMPCSHNGSLRNIAYCHCFSCLLPKYQLQLPYKAVHVR